jgi:PilZ domain
MLPDTKPRRHARIGLHRGPLVAWQGSAGRTVSRVATLGMGGLFIAAEEPAPLGEGIRMVFQVPEGEVRARATVRNSHPGKGMGVEFTSMKPEDRARLHRLVRQLLAELSASNN